ncbi:MULTISPECIES: flagellar basal body P-ring formation chaperone FlgA [Pseudoalteromonas]|uniref:Flagella basal body P-ring formation protein FlgA n=1 Tax=Pseudoalteromonas peptidolytica F12-50-A1 TaxID=1315280 RepID=A0A8I0MWS9_9GAMM|nr:MULTISPECIES: flagellar basal body P-ring formation chaperone FlgA [Pseudoalteromonas]MBE0346913.1 flagella basal body P-ring formation protein FlgA [Pseudoalteromonas peptidolytica F12-50-A1]NLR13975.1 flagellar basal body P-ring formation protein FlgA [Pseudoalteromonas peptidolytica]RXF07150.1 flagella basal body P-ring formation protein FlgA [Pseudoalteromonas sp. PS5]GEK10842.1 flagellar basal body P-ring biosynthesis protein FlgA [Pseudoalteromonas peptidolytica]
MSLLKKTRYIQLFCLFAHFISIGYGHCQQYDNKALEQTAVDFVAPQVELDPDSQLSIFAIPLDSRIPTRVCQAPLVHSTAATPPFNTQVTVQIKCDDLQGWTQYVHVRIEHLFPVLVSATMLEKGRVITEDDIKVEMQPKRFRRVSYIEDRTLLIGSRSKRNIREGQAFTQSHICMVCKGDNVTIFAKSGGLVIKTQGEAMQDGNRGELITVKNTRSGKTLRARVIEVETVEVNL